MNLQKAENPKVFFILSRYEDSRNILHLCSGDWDSFISHAGIALHRKMRLGIYETVIVFSALRNHFYKVLMESGLRLIDVQIYYYLYKKICF